MTERYVFGSLARISNLPEIPFKVQPLKKSDWETGDYVVGQFVPSSDPVQERIETTTGRLRQLFPGDLLVGALGVRKATKEIVGDWHLIGNDGKMQAICGSGIFGAETDFAKSYGPSPCFVYQGHVLREGTKVCMKHFVKNVQTSQYSCPTILIIGTSMSCGKTIAASAIIRQLKAIGVKRVVGTKLTGAGFLNDKLSMEGADAVYDFVDVGLPSTILPADEYKTALQSLLSIISSEQPSIVVAEAGASPCESYNGNVVLDEMAGKADLIVLCASDPYAAVGATKILKEKAAIRPNFVTGLVTSNTAGQELIHNLCDVPPLSLSTEEGLAELKKILTDLMIP